MAQLLSGTGRIVIRSLSTTIPDFVFVEPLAFKINTNSSEIVAYKMVNGRKVPAAAKELSLIHISEPTRPRFGSRMPSSA